MTSQSPKPKQVKPNQPSTKTKSPKKATPIKPYQKKISLKSIKEEQKQLNTMSSYVVHADTNHVIKYYKKFDQRKVQALLMEAYEKLVYVQQNDEIEYFIDDEQFITFIQYLAIKYFTHFGDEIGDTFEDDIEAMNSLVSLGYFKLILNDILDPNEIYELIITMKEFIEAAGLAMEAEMKARREIEDKVENKFILNALGNKEDADNG